jgi:hypothetical protein
MERGAMRIVGRSLLAGVAVAAVLLVAGCGNSEITITGTSEGISVYTVVQSDSTGIGLVKQKISAEKPANLIAAMRGTVSDGSNPVGIHICGFSVSKNGHSYQVDRYAASLPAGVTSSEAAATACSSSLKSDVTSWLPAS